MAKITAPMLRKMKQEGKRIVFLTAYDQLSASLAQAASVDAVLVGDSLGNVIQGHDTTLPVSLEDVCYHVRAVRRAISSPLLVADMPFGSYGSSVAQAVDSGVALMKAGAEAVKLEGLYLDEIRALVKAGIPVMGHLGMTPQSVHVFGGFKVQGREQGEKLIGAARLLEEAGAFSMVLELIPADLAARVTEAVTVPTIGIGAGLNCSGEVQVFHDILGLNERAFRHTRHFLNGREQMASAISDYVSQVRESQFPGPENSV
jgi:3-methyl-2-oxobutanoate hydroxymethyltransferase